MSFFGPRLTVVLLVPLCLTASAATPPPPGNYVLTQISTGQIPYYGSPINASGQVVGSYPIAPFLWTPASANAPVGSEVPISGVVPSPGTAVAANAINSRGQVVGSGPHNQVFLWSPDTPSGNSGASVILPVSSTIGPKAINSFGQVIANEFLWTPSTENGATGTVNPDSRFKNAAGINDFGQVIINPPGPATPLLFTPTTANGATGTFTPISGIDYVLAINNNGAILGESTCGAPGCQFFLWTPASPNGATGTVSEIPVPAEFTGVNAHLLNDSGQVAGEWCRLDSTGACTSTAPFLYTGGIMYDLSTLTTGLGGAQFVAGINNHGQIVVNPGLNAQGVYLLSPVTPTLASGVPVTISSNPSGRVFTVTGTGCSPGAYAAPQTLNWTAAASCTITFLSPQSDALFIQYLFTGWQDGATANSRTIVAPGQAATYTANFKKQCFITVQASPPEGGSVSGGGWYDANTTVTFTENPASGYDFAFWGPSLGRVSTTPLTVTVSSPGGVTAFFVRRFQAPSGNYVVTRIAASSSASPPRPLNNFGQVALTGSSGLLWTPSTPNGTAGSIIDLGFSRAASINDRGQVAGSNGVLTPGEQAMLWSPNAANGTIGSSVAFLGAPSRANGINDFGQVIGYSGCSYDESHSCNYTGSFLWTPSSPNGATGTVNTSIPAAAINDFGQAIISEPGASVTQLFTPSVANGSAGSLTDINGLPLYGPGTVISLSQLLAINSTGAIAGMSSQACCGQQGFLWTPSSPNGTTGLTAAIPLPPGFVSLQPAALNAGGQAVGIVTQANGVSRPFLYQNGTVYDLGTVSAGIAEGSAVGINDHGQIVMNANGSVYLLTPHVALPGATGVCPASGLASGQSMVFTFSDPRGWQDLGVVNILINNFLDGRQSCYIAYSQPLNTLYLVNDAGNALLPALPLNGSGSVGNSQCTLSAAGSSVSENGNTLTLMLNLSFSAAFGGNHVVYLAAGDAAGNNSGWQPLGTWSVPIAVPAGPAVGGVSPAYGSGSAQTFTFTFTDSNGWADLGVVDILINGSLDGRQACYLAYSRAVNALYLVNDAGTELLPGLVMSGAGTLSNSQCTVSAGAPALTVTGNTLTLTLGIAFSPAFSGDRVIYLGARNFSDSATSGWQAVGTWSVQ